MKEIKVGQIYKIDEDSIFVISRIDEYFVSIIYNNGFSDSDFVYVHNFPKYMCDLMIAEYPTWQEAVNSPEFKGEINAG